MPIVHHASNDPGVGSRYNERPARTTGAANVRTHERKDAVLDTLLFVRRVLAVSIPSVFFISMRANADMTVDSS